MKSAARDMKSAARDMKSAAHDMKSAAHDMKSAARDMNRSHHHGERHLSALGGRVGADATQACGLPIRQRAHRVCTC